MIDLQGQNRILIFTIMAKSKKPEQKEKRDHIPIADFLSSSYDSLSIECYLKKIVNKFKCYSFFKLPKVVVTDFSWASINAILAAFNDCKPIHYLNWAFNLMIHNKEELRNIFPVRIYLCSTHLLKNINDDFRKNKKKSEISSFKRDFIFGFSLLQNSVKLTEFNEILVALFNIYNRKFISKNLRKYLLKLKIKIEIRNMEWLSSLSAVSKSENKVDLEFFFEDQEILSYQKNSPFSLYFDTLLKNEEKNIFNEEILFIEYEKNDLYCPSIFNIIRKRLYIMPLWTGILLNDCLEDYTTRLSNNSLESWFGHLKNDLLCVNKRINTKRRCFPSEIAAPLFNYIKIKFEKYKNIFDLNFKNFEKIKITPEDVEMWKFPERASNSKKDPCIRSFNGYTDFDFSEETINKTFETKCFIENPTRKGNLKIILTLDTF